jgi:hypothetical protein
MTMLIDHSAERWLSQYAMRNLWRVSDWYELDDLIQEGLLYWHWVATYYQDTVHDRPHMMRLFQATYRNRIHALALERTRRLTNWRGSMVREDHTLDQEQWEYQQFSDHGEQAAGIELAGLLAHAPEPVRCLLAFLARNDGPARLRSLASGPGSFNRRVAQLIGWSGRTPNFHRMLSEYLGD